MRFIVVANQEGGVDEITFSGHLTVGAERANSGGAVLVNTNPRDSSASDGANAKPKLLILPRSSPSSSTINSKLLKKGMGTYRPQHPGLEAAQTPAAANLAVGRKLLGRPAGILQSAKPQSDRERFSKLKTVNVQRELRSKAFARGSRSALRQAPTVKFTIVSQLSRPA